MLTVKSYHRLCFASLAILALLLPLCLLVGSSDAKAEQIPVPKLSKRVTDLTQTLTAEQVETLAKKLQALEKTKGSQLAVLIVPTTGEEGIEQFAIRVVDEWKLGRKGTADGVLLLVAKNDKRVRIEVGRGLEGALTDVTSARIIREFVRPAFKQNNFYAGIDAGIDKISAVIAGELLPAPPPSKGHSANYTNDINILGLHPLVWLGLLIAGLVLSKILGPWLGRGGLAAGSAAAAMLAGTPVIMALVAGALMVAIYSLLASRVFWDIAGAVLQSGAVGGFGGGHGGGGGNHSSNDGFSGGGGDFGGGGASGDW